MFNFPKISLHIALFVLLSVSSAFSLTNNSRSTVVSAKMFVGESPAAFSIKNAQQRTLTVAATVSREAVYKAQTLVLTDFPISITENGSLILQRSSSILDANAEVWSGKNLIPAPEMHSFYGEIEGESGSKVFLSFINGEIYGIIEHADHVRYTFVPTTISKNPMREHVLVNSQQVAENNAPLAFSSCGSDLKPEQLKEMEKIRETAKNYAKPLAATQLLEAVGAVEVATDVYHRMGSDVNREMAYFMSMYALISRIYEDELNIAFTLNYMHFFTDDAAGDEDPYTNTHATDMNKVPNTLLELPIVWKNKFAGRAFVQLLTMPPNASGSYVAGKASGINTVCSSSQGYCVATLSLNPALPTLNYSADVHIPAHELGHLFGGIHTHDCNYWHPAVDTCVTTDQNANGYAGDACFNPAKRISNGTIMSYCHLLNNTVLLTFGPRVIADMRSKAEAKTCLKSPVSPMVRIQYPVGNQTVAANNPLEIRWTSAKVTNVTMEYSTNAGDKWDNIATQLATDRKYQWMVPPISSTQMLVRVYDATNSAVGDTCITKFTVSAPALTLTYPAGGEQIAQGSTITIIWTSNLIDSVNLYYSIDNGTKWWTIQTGVKTPPNSIDWLVPATISSKQVVVKVVNATNNSLVSQSGLFAVGLPKINALIAPNGGEYYIGTTVEKIKWQSEFMSQVNIMYSTDDGAIWRKVPSNLSGNVDATSGEYAWTVPNVTTTKARVKIRNAADANATPLISAATFNINIFDGVAEHSQVISPISMEIVPSPVIDFGWIRFTLSSFTKEVNISLRDVTGRIITQISSMQSIQEGDHATEFNVQTLAQGVYFVVLEADGIRAVKPITVIR